eukprot:UN21942
MKEAIGMNQQRFKLIKESSRPSAIHSIHFILLFENEKND